MRSLVARRLVLAIVVAMLLPPVAQAVRRRAPVLYVVRGYLEPAPDGVEVIDRVDVNAPGKDTRWLAVTSYLGPGGPVGLGGYLSRSLRHPWQIAGKKADVERLFAAPPGTQLQAKFLVYTSGAPILSIAEIQYATAPPTPTP